MKTRICFDAALVLLMVTSLSCVSGSDDDDSDYLDDDSVDDTGCDENLAKGEIWVDPAANLTWQTGSSCDDRGYNKAVEYCESLEIGDVSDWRLPSISEMRSLIRGCPATETGGECPLTDECQDWDECKDGICNGCQEDEGPTDGCYGPPELQNPCESFWTTNINICVRFGTGGVVKCWTGNEEGGGKSVRCVRP